ncbi:MAG: hypothetical protein CEO22_663 [Candidatus Berkelbacteria bacterium Gr01-1014_85]|uniref:Type IV pilus assembly protein PilO n=1 Tax=Candidatus Berkelbacteria bacterium Gr01-1014_85 TaxID=2017150 RepID=A0A554J9A5_9BACT|nr:MAG: hypothetical protein CEO22_663 [Candidatus Berkelbacteria bacterium Gr01-1014_85]
MKEPLLPIDSLETNPWLKVCLSLFVLNLIFGYFLTYKPWQANKATTTKQSGLNRDLARLKAKKIPLSQLQAKADELTSLNQRANLLIPADQSRQNFVTEFQGLAAARNLQVLNLNFSSDLDKAKPSPSPTASATAAASKSATAKPEAAKPEAANKQKTGKADPLSSYSIKFEAGLSGDYSGLRALVADLNRSQRLVEIQTIVISGNGELEGLKLTGRIFTKPPVANSENINSDLNIPNLREYFETKNELPAIPAEAKANPFRP